MSMGPVPDHVKGTRMEAVHRSIDALPDDEYVIVMCIRPLNTKEQTMVVLSGHDDQLIDTMNLLDHFVEAKVKPPKQRPS